MVSDKEIQFAIGLYKQDILNYPIYFNPTTISLLDNEIFIYQIKNKLNRNYRPALGKTFLIPYDRISTREIITLELEDIIIRYVLKIELQKKIKVLANNNDCNADLSVLIDISDFYQSVNHDVLISIFKASGEISDNSDLLEVLKGCLKVSFLKDNKIKTLNSGLLIGSKPDEYFAEIFLNYVQASIQNEITPKIQRFSDEFLIFGSDINEIRETVQKVRSLLSNFGLKINLSKTKLIKETRSKQEFESNLKLFEESKLIGSASMPTFWVKNGFEVITKPIAMRKDDQVVKMKNEISNYEDSIVFLKSLYQSYTSLNEYQQKYPDYKYFYNIVFSQPTDFLLDYEKLNFEIIEIENIKTVKDIIVKYPKSEYYSAIAINILVFIAKGLFYSVNHSIVRDLKHKIRSDIEEFNYQVPSFDSKITEACEFANFQIIELLKSDEIFEHQKYLILRTLFMNKNNLSISIKNFEIKKINGGLVEQFLNPNYHMVGGFKPELPFKELILTEIKRLNDVTKHFALKSITEHLINN